jgi:hypothetical protein
MRTAKLNPSQTAEVLQRLQEGATALEIAKQFRCSDQTIYRIRDRAKERAMEVGVNRPALVVDAPPINSASETPQADPLTGVTMPVESDVAICRNVTRDLYRAFRAAGKEGDRRSQVDIGKTIAAVVRARHQIAPPKTNRGPLKTYTVEASPDVWPDPPAKGATPASGN